MSRSSVILRNVASNWVGFAINAAVTLALTPYVLRELGSGRYGIWILTSSIIGYYGLLDLGFRAGVTQYLTRYLAARDFHKASETISSAVAVLSALGGLILILSIGGAYLAPRIFSLPGGLEREAFWCILIVGSSSAIQFALQPYTSLFTATQRFDLANAIGVVTRLLSAAGIVVALRMGGGLIGVSAATCTASAIDYLIRWHVARRLSPDVTVSFGLATLQRVREISVFGAWNTVVSLNALVYQHMPSLLIGTVLPIAAVGHYALATGLVRQLNSVLSPIGQVMYPAAAALHVQGDRDRLERLYHDASRLMLLIMIPVVILTFLWAPAFYRLWVGAAYVSNDPFTSVAVIFQILLISIVTTYSSSIASQILIGAGHVRTVALALITGTAVSVTISVALIKPLGLMGVAIGTVTASILIDLVAMPILLERRVGLSALHFVRDACARPVATGAIQMLLLYGLHGLHPAENWFQLLAQGLIGSTAALLIAVAIGVTSLERERFLYQPTRRVLRRLAFST